MIRLLGDIFFKKMVLIMKKNKLEFNIILTIFMVILCFMITVGYAVYNQGLNLTGKLTISPIGKVEIVRIEQDTNASIGSADGRLASDVLKLDENGNIGLNYAIKHNNSERTEQGTYLIYIENNSMYDYTFTGITMNPELIVYQGSADDVALDVSYTHDVNHSSNTIRLGTTLSTGESGVVVITLNIYSGSKKNVSIGVGGGTNINSSLDNSGSLEASIDTDYVDLSGDNESACFQVNVMNTFKYARNFSLKSGNENFYLVDVNGNPLSDFHIGAPSELDSNSNVANYEVCLVVNPSSIFTSESASTRITLNSNEVDPIVAGDINIKVDITEEEDNDKVQIGNVAMSIGSYDQATGALKINTSWSRLDAGGTNVQNYYVLLVDATTGTQIASYEIDANYTSQSITLDSNFLATHKTNMVTNNHNYLIKVYGVDENNSGVEDCFSGVENPYCVASPSISLKWEFNVLTSGLSNMNLSSGSPTKAYIYNTYVGKLEPADKYKLPSSITVSMGGSDLTLNTDYTYDSSTGAGDINITKTVTGDISISGTAQKKTTCLAEGTKIKLANGKYKNIEDIRYDDLIMSYSYDLGKVVYEYPIWIEKESVGESYQKITFSDGTYLNTVGEHGIYNVDLKKYVSVMDRDNFYVGTRVVKFDENNQKKILKVKKIEVINKPVKYYHVTANRYHNILANDILTTDAFLVVSNMFAFDDNIMWTNEREEFLKTNDLFYYEDWTHMFERHLFAGYRMPETKHLYNQGLLDIEYGSWLLGRLALDPMKSRNGKNAWMVTTSDDLAKGKKGLKLEEQSIFTLPKPVSKSGKKFVGWYSTADHKYYQPGEKISVDYGLYFEAVWK